MAIADEELNKIKVYLDNCSFNRPYDDQKQERIYLETISKLYIQNMIKQQKLDFAWSFISDYENSMNPYEMRRESIKKFSYRCMEYVDYAKKDEILSVAGDIVTTGIKEKDAIHVSCAIYANCDYFITTDDRLLRLKRNDIMMINPMMFVKEMEENE